jgi:penicillin-binding protein 1C
MAKKNNSKDLKKVVYKKPSLWSKKWVKITYKSLLGVLAVFLLSFIILYAYVAKDLPSVVNLDDRKVIQSTQIYDRTGQELLYEISGNENRTIIPKEEIPDILKQAFISIEDQEFYKHWGVRPTAIIRAAFQNITGKGVGGGGSTITQQFVKNALLTSDRSLMRKIREAILAIQIEQKYSKDEIIAFYLNEIPFGGNIYGVEAASQSFFGKKPNELEAYQAAMMAAIIQRPTFYSPYGSNFDKLEARQKFVLLKMKEQSYITEEVYNQQKDQKLVIKPFAQNIKAPHFVFYVREKLAEKFGEESLEQGGLKVQTTLDWNLQQIAEKAVKEEVEKTRSRYDTQNAALGAIDPTNGDILAMVGSKDYFNTKEDGNVNVLTTQQSPGSSIKPLVYAQAFTKGYNPDSYLFDLPTNFETTPGLPAYEPNNFNLQFNGPVSIRRALATSLNVPAVKALYLAGIKDTLDLGNKLGITDYKKDRKSGLAMALGGAELKLIEHFGSYSAFANDGKFNKITPLMKVTKTSGEVIYSWERDEKQVLDKNVARQITDILSDNNARSPVFGFTNNLNIPGVDAAAKTGTSQEFRDALTVGYTTNLVAGVWVGKNDNKPMRNGADGSVVASPIWNRFMKEAIASGRKPEKFTKPEIKRGNKPMVNTGGFEYNKKLKINKATGKVATDRTPPELIEEREVKTVHSELYYVKLDDILGDWPKKPQEDPQFDNWERPVLAWARSKGYITNLPDDEDNVYTDENKPIIKINSPTKGSLISGNSVPLDISVTASQGLKQVDIYLDEIVVFSSTSGTISQSITAPSGGNKVLTVRAFDIYLNKSESSTNITIKLDSVSPVVESFSVLGDKISGFNLSANITDLQGVAQVEFYDDTQGQLIILKNPTTAPKTYSYLYRPPAGVNTFSFYIKTTDTSGNVTTSNKITK